MRLSLPFVLTTLSIATLALAAEPPAEKSTGEDVGSSSSISPSAATAPTTSPPETATPAGKPPAAARERRPFDHLPAESFAVRELREIITRERAVWERLKKHPDDDALQERSRAEFRDIITAYENLLRRAPEFAEAYADYGLLLSRVGDRENALKAFVRANQLNPNIAMVKNQLGNLLAESGDYKQAIAYYLSATELEPNEPLYHYQIGSLLYGYRDLFIKDGLYTREQLDREMQAAFRRAAELAPDTWGYIYRYAESFYDLEKPDWPAALAEWRELEKKADGDLGRQTVRLHEANVLLKMNRPDEARALLETVTDPGLASNKQTLVAQLAETPKK